MRTTSTHTPSRFPAFTPNTSHFGFKHQLIFAFGALGFLAVVMAGVTLWSMVNLDRSVQKLVETDGHMERLANNIAIQMLLCRSYEKDLFLHIADDQTHSQSLEQWNNAITSLRQAIDAFEVEATTPEDRLQVSVWRQVVLNYRTAVLDIEQGIIGGRVTSPDAANRALESSKDAVRLLTESALDVARQKDRSVQVTSEALRENSKKTTQLTELIVALFLLLILGCSYVFPRRVTRPVIALRDAAEQIANGDLSARVELRRRDELGMLAHSFNQMAANLRQAQGAVEEQQLLLEQRVAERTAELERALHELRASLDQRDLLTETMRRTSCPVVPILDGVLVMPLIGMIDSQRAGLLIETLLAEIERQRARYALIDMTGVPVVDTYVANMLVSAAAAAKLLGTQVILVGLRPEIVQTIVALNLDLATLITQANLQNGVRYALRRDA